MASLPCPQRGIQPTMKPPPDPAHALVPAVGDLGEAYWSWVEQPVVGHPRFFASDVLEACSKTPWWLVPCLWVPVFGACFWHAHARLGVPLVALAAWLAAGVLAWQLLEYSIHRWAFHARMTSRWGIIAHFLLHGCHHKFPLDRLRLVFPPVPASLLVMAVYVALHAALPACHALPLFAGMGFGYVAYDCLHYAVHHHGSRLPGGPLQALRAHHMRHHYKDPAHGFGISSELYDWVFRTHA